MINDYSRLYADSQITLTLMINQWQTFSNNQEGFENAQGYLLVILSASVLQNGFLNASI